jgi:nucleoside-diphosphate-sugar epimerase
MPTILVTGAGGGLGHNVVDAALARGLSVRALVRNPKKSHFGPGVEVVSGDALDSASVTRAAAGCDALFHMVNVGFNADWVGTTARLLDAALAACKQTGARLVFPANVWVFGKGTPGARVNELASFAPISTKGRARAEKEARIKSSGVRYTMLRLPEFYGPHVGTLTGPPLMRIAHRRKGTWLAPMDVDVEFVFMPDAAEALLTIGLADGMDGEVFHFPGASAITPRSFLELAVDVAKGGTVGRLPVPIVRLAGVFSKEAREFVDILHLWTDPILLDGGKLSKCFPQIRTTPYREGLAQTIAWLRENPNAPMHF